MPWPSPSQLKTSFSLSGDWCESPVNKSKRTMMCPENEECWFGTCSHETCGFADVYSLPNEPHLTELPAKWNKWQDIEGRLVKHEETGSVANLHSCIESIATKFFKHCFVKRLQSKSYEADKAKSANPDSDTAVLQMNFADNFTCMAQDEVSRLIGTRLKWHCSLQLLVPVQCHMTVIISDCLHHDKTSLVVFLDEMLSVRMARVKNSHFEKIWSSTVSTSTMNNQQVGVFIAIMAVGGK